MSYKIEDNKIIFDEPPREGTEVEVTVSTQQTLNGFGDPRSYYPRRVNEVDTNRLAVNYLSKQHPVVDFKKKLLITADIKSKDINIGKRFVFF